jgi:transcriptional regulator with XRE-family HTH domain
VARQDGPPRAQKSTPTISRTQLGVRLRQLREEQGLKLSQVATRMLVSPSKLSRLEAGTGGVKERDLRDLCEIYGVGDAERDQLMNLAKQSREETWWQHRDPDLPERYVGLEAAASAIRDFKTDVIPGLLQTDGYAHAVLAATLPEGTAPTTVDDLAATRRTRQAILAGDRPLQLRVVFDEAAAHRLVGGRAVMREQLNALADYAKQPYISLRMLAFEAGAHPALASNFTILQFEQPLTPDVVFIEGLSGNRYLEARDETARYGRIFDRICDLSLSERKTVTKLAAIARSIGRR